MKVELMVVVLLLVFLLFVKNKLPSIMFAALLIIIGIVYFAQAEYGDIGSFLSAQTAKMKTFNSPHNFLSEDAPEKSEDAPEKSEDAPEKSEDATEKSEDAPEKSVDAADEQEKDIKSKKILDPYSRKDQEEMFFINSMRPDIHISSYKKMNKYNSILKQEFDASNSSDKYTEYL